MTTCVMHRLAVKFCTMFRRTLAACWHRPVVALAVVEMMIDVSIEAVGPVKPGSQPRRIYPLKTTPGHNSRRGRNYKEEPRNIHRDKQAVLQC